MATKPEIVIRCLAIQAALNDAIEEAGQKETVEASVNYLVGSFIGAIRQLANAIVDLAEAQS